MHGTLSCTQKIGNVMSNVAQFSEEKIDVNSSAMLHPSVFI